jgi:hypothetical protein
LTQPFVRVTLGALHALGVMTLFAPVLKAPLVRTSVPAAPRVRLFASVTPAPLFSVTLVIVVAPAKACALVPLKVKTPVPEVNVPPLLKLPVRLTTGLLVLPR